jgi:hypothetical protein
LPVSNAIRGHPILRRAGRVALAVSVVLALVAATAALAGRLPAQGTWRYDNTATLKSVEGTAQFRVFVHVLASKANIYSLDGIVIGGTCKGKDGETHSAGATAFSAVRTLVSVKRDGSFSAARNVVGDATGVKGTAKVKGVFNGAYVSGTVSVHMRNPIFGDCKATGKFVRAKGERIA